jgi:outer membrane protein assembly factor BamB
MNTPSARARSYRFPRIPGRATECRFVLSSLASLLLAAGCRTIGEDELERGPESLIDSSRAAGVEAPAGGWTEWRGPARDGTLVLPAGALPSPLPESWPEAWRVEVGIGYSGIVVGEGLVYCLSRRGDREVVTAHQAATGREAWSHVYEIASWSQPFEAFGIDDGPLATPALAGGRLYTVGIHGRVHCLDARTGAVIYSVTYQDLGGEEAEARYGHAVSPLVRRGRLFVAFSSKSKGQLVALEAGTGRLLWRALPEPIAYASPVYASIAGVEQVVVRTWKRIAGIDPATGEVLWSFEASAGGIKRDCATPLVAGDVVYDTNDYHGTLALRISRGPDGAWQAGKVFRSGALGGAMASPVHHQGSIYGLHRSGHLVCIDGSTGARRWIERAFGKYLSMISLGERVIALDERGELAVLRLSPAGPTFEGRWKIGASTWTYPALDGERLYYRDGKELIAFRLRDAQGAAPPPPENPPANRT